MKNKNKPKKMRITAGITAVQIPLAIWALLQLFPIYWLLVLSFKSNQEIFSGNSISLPTVWRFENYDFVFRNGNMNLPV